MFQIILFEVEFPCSLKTLTLSNRSANMCFVLFFFVCIKLLLKLFLLTRALPVETIIITLQKNKQINKQTKTR
jgi:hypothetical protein